MFKTFVSLLSGQASYTKSACLET